MKTLAITVCGLLFLTLALTTVSVAQCTDCNITTHMCLPPTRSNCACDCETFTINGVLHCSATGICGEHGNLCPAKHGLNTQTMIDYPWITSVDSVKELASHSTMPNAAYIFEEVRTIQLKDGANAIRRGYVQDSGYRLNSGTPAIAASKTKGTQWWQLASDDAQKTQVLTLWDDPDLKWKTTGDIHHSTLRLPVTETITFYSDHWEQANAKGVFNHTFEASAQPQATGSSARPLVSEDKLGGK
jgi:hypothetical protein